MRPDTEKRLATLSTNAQDVQNIGTLAAQMLEVSRTLWLEAYGKGETSDWVNTHPDMRLMVWRMMELSRLEEWDHENFREEFMKSARIARNQAEHKPREFDAI